MGRADAYDAALLDVAQDHLLHLLAEAGVFDDGSLTFKGGTSLRKCRLGNDGRFSTDLDFAAPDEDVMLAVCVDEPTTTSDPPCIQRRLADTSCCCVTTWLAWLRRSW
jgi:predicted nucleotidyltransferase component of viral defense system